MRFRKKPIEAHKYFFPDGTSCAAPDFLCYSLSTYSLFWAECKNKTNFVELRNYGCWTTGIDKKAFDNYMKVWRQTKTPVFIYFLQNGGTDKHTGKKSEPGLFYQNLDILNLRIHESTGKFNNEMVYWDREVLERLI